VRAEGLEPDEHGLRLLEGMASGRLDAAEAVERLLAPYRR
jgi:hypothetical protein